MDAWLEATMQGVSGMQGRFAGAAKTMQEFPFAHPEVKCKINRIYNSSFPCTVASESVKQMVNSWSVSVRQMWGLPVQAHRYLVRELGGQHAEEMLITRYVKFLQSIKKSPKLAVQFILERIVRNVNTITGSNVRFIQGKIGHVTSFK